MTVREATSFCRICSGACGMHLTIDDDEDRIIAIRGNRDDLMTRGYACFKGLQADEAHHGSARLLRPLKRQPDGSYTHIDSEQAIDEIAGKIAMLIDRHGPDALGVFCGNGALYNVPAYRMHRNFLAALGSRQYFSTITIDQSAKFISAGRLGSWAAGYADLKTMDVAMLVGANPMVAHGSPPILLVDPVKRLKQARANGLKLIVIDPRRTETANNADLLLQPYPGEDVAILGGMIRIILSEGWEDRAFCADYVGEQGIAALRAAVEPLTPDYVEARAGLEPGQLFDAIALFARDSRVGGVHTATGLCMAPFSNLAQHLAETINILCGRYLREGEAVHQMDPLAPRYPVHAEVMAPGRNWEEGGPSRIRGMYQMFGERPTGTLTDEILTPGKDRIRALILDGSNPLTSLPDQRKAAQAMAALDLLVSIDPWRTPSTHFAHYILPPRMQYERADLQWNPPGMNMFPGSHARYAPAVLHPPKGSDVVDDWYVFWAIAKRLGRTIAYDGVPLDMETPPTTDDLIAILIRNGHVSLDDLKANPNGIEVAIDEVVKPRRDEAQGRFDIMPDDVRAELEAYLAKAAEQDAVRFTHRLSTRRMRDLFNSIGRDVKAIRKRTPYNPAFMHPDDLAAHGVAVGDRVELVSAHGRVTAIVGVDDGVKPGVISMAHGWGALPGSNEDPAETGSAVNALIDTDRNFESINAMPHMTGVPINIVRLPG